MKVLLTIVIWSLPVVAAVGGGVWIHFDGKWRQQARIDAANTEVREAVKGADGWLKRGSAKEGENVEQRLMQAIAAKDVSEKANADAVLETVRTRRAELAADSLFDGAKTKLDAKDIVEAVALLNRYVADRHATKKAEARQLLADYELATSDKAALQTLMALGDEQFAQFKNTGKLDDCQITHPILAEIRATTLRRNLETDNQRREAIKLAEANRQHEEKRTAEANRKKSEDAALAAARAAESAKAAKEQEAIEAAELIQTKLVGVWTWGKSLDASIKFTPDGKYVEGRSRWVRAGTWGHWEPMQGQWRVEKDGTIWLSGSPPHELLVVKLNLKEDKLSIGYRYPLRDKAYNGDVVASRSNHNGMTPAEFHRYLEQQMRAISQHGGNPRLRRQAADNVKALGREAADWAEWLVPVALNDSDKVLQRKAIEALGEMDRCLAIEAIAPALLRTRDREVAKAAEDSLLKLLPALGKRLGINRAIVLWPVHESGNQRLAPAIESAWAAGGLSQDAVANEFEKRRKEALAASEHLNAARRDIRARREWEEAHWAELHPSAPRGDGRVKWPDEPKHEAPSARNSYDPMKGGTPQRPNP